MPKIDNTRARPRLAAARRDGRSAEAHLRRLSRAGRRSAAAGGLRCTAQARAMLLALKIDVDTLRGTREGVPNLVLLLKKYGADATFLFSLGPDHTGRAIKRVFRRGFFGKVRRTSVVRHYGLKTLLYGTVLPGPDIGRRARDVMRATRDAGFETGIHTWDHVRWQDGVAGADAAWTRAEMQRACDRYTDIFGTPPLAHGAAGWQMNVHALRLTQRLGFEYCSDGRGTHPHLPVWNGELIRCPQLPTTLADARRAHRPRRHHRNQRRRASSRADEGGPLRRTSTRCTRSSRACVSRRSSSSLLAGWKAQGWRLVSMRTLARYAATACAPALRGRSGRRRRPFRHRARAARGVPGRRRSRTGRRSGEREARLGESLTIARFPWISRRSPRTARSARCSSSSSRSSAPTDGGAAARRIRGRSRCRR